jgi:hypothetical protein
VFYALICVDPAFKFLSGSVTGSLCHRDPNTVALRNETAIYAASFSGFGFELTLSLFELSLFALAVGLKSGMYSVSLSFIA